ncbi:MAG: hypothetical protein F6K45_23100 [Kamptonema sp. SIO1D9]|nr:hypothetical protein [Kamptonema sp. SIO1D9]
MSETKAETRYYRSEIEELLSIKKDTYYKWLKHLGIKPKRDDNNKTYLDDSDLELLSDLKDYYDEKGTIEGFQSGSEIVKVDNQSSAIAHHLEFDEPENIEEDPRIEELLNEAAELKARSLMMSDLIKLNLADQMKEEDLPPHLRDRIARAREAANPTQAPATIASNLLNRWRKNKSA